MSEHLTFGDIVRQARLKKDLSLRDVEELGVGITFSYISKLEKGQYTPSKEVVTNLANALDIPLDEALLSAGYVPKDFIQRIGRVGHVTTYPGAGKTGPTLARLGFSSEEIKEAQRIAEKLAGTIVTLPVVGTVAAGVPILAEENIDQYMDFPKDLAEGATFALKVRGDSMIGVGIFDGDYVVIKQQPTAENGQTVVARIDGAVTIKRFYKLDDKIRLEPANGGYKPIEAKDIEIIGVVMAVTRKFF